MTDRTHPDSGFPIAYSHYANYAEYVEALHARIAVLEAQLESIGAGGVSGPLMGQPQAMPDLSALTERGAKAWAGVDAQGLREGVASAGADCARCGGNGEWWADHLTSWAKRFVKAAPQPSPTPQADSQPAPMGQNESAYQRGYMDGMAKGRREAEAGGHAAPQPAVQQGDTEVLLIAAVDEWFAKNTGLGGCSDKDVQELQAIFAADRAASAPADSVTAPAGGATAEPRWKSEDFEVTHYPPMPTTGMRVGMPKGVKVTHRPTGLFAVSEDERSQHMNREVAWNKLQDMLAAAPTPPAQAADSVLEDAALLERERICAAIKAEDDYCVDHGDYMLDSDDCIKIVRGEWVRPDFSVDAARKQGSA